MKFVKITYLLLVNALVGAHLASALGTIEGSVPDEAQSQSEQQYLQRQLTGDTASLDVKRGEFSAYELTEDGLPIFGSQLFQGDFADLSFGGFNPDYQIALGDQIQVLIWGAMSEELKLRVDAKGNVFIPRVGPVHVLGVRNADLNKVIQQEIEQVYKENVESYASLSSTQTVKVFVSGFVNKPGLYQGFASDSVLYYLDRAGGVDAKRGSYLQVSLVRADEVIKVIDLYRFLESGRMPLTQFRDGDVVLIKARGHTVTVTGNVINSGRFEFDGECADLTRILELAGPKPNATSVSVRRVHEGHSKVHVYEIGDLESVQLLSGDVVDVTSREVASNLLVAFSGEHGGVENRVYPLGTTLAEVIQSIAPTAQSNLSAIQVFRRSVAERQRELIHQSLDNLERQVLMANSVSLEEAQLRQVEAQTILSFIQRARQVEPSGQIIIDDLTDAEQLYIQDGDVVHIPAQTNLVTVHGEVKYPNTQLYRSSDSIKQYIKRAGGFSENANAKELILVQPNGVVRSLGKGRGYDPQPGDEIIVLAKLDAKKLMFAKEISTIMYQIALGAAVVVGIN